MFTNMLHAQSVNTFWKWALKGEYEKVDKKLQKEDAVNSNSAVLQSVVGLYYLHATDHINLDTSYQHFQIADSLWSESDEDEKEDWLKGNVSEDSIIFWLNQVEELAFIQCEEEMEEESFVAYIKRFPNSLLIPRAIELRDSLGFETAKEEHSYTSYEAFVRTYPNAKQAEEAKEKYELLVFHSKTKDADEKALSKFLREHPDNPHREKVEGQLYTLRTENRSTSDYIQFIRDYPKSIYADSAITHLWYFTPAKDSILLTYPGWSEKQYYQSVLDHNKQLYPVIREDGMVFMEKNGQTFLQDQFTDASNTYNCQGTHDRYLEVTKSTGTGWVDWKGKEVVACQYDEVNPLDEGLVSVKKNGKYGVYALNEGEWLPLQYDQVLRISNRLFGIRKKARWGIISIEGDVKFPFEAGQLIHISDNMVLIMKKGRWANYKEIDIHNGNIKTDDSIFHFEGYKVLNDQWYALSEEGKWSIYSPNGKKWNKGKGYDEIKDAPDESGWFVRQDTLWQLMNYDLTVKIDSMLLPVEVKNRGVIAKWRNNWTAYTWEGEKISSHQSDTMSFINDDLDLLIEKDKEYWVRFKSGKALSMKKYSKWNVTHIETDSLQPAFLSVKSKKNKKFALVSESGTQVMTPQFSKLNVYPEGLVVAKYGSSEFLYSVKGKKVLKEGYTSIKYDNGVFHLMLKGKYGLYVPDSSFKVSPQFEAPLKKTHLEKEGITLWLGKKKGLYGLLTLANADQARLYYDKMEPITDRFSFVWEDERWKLLDVKGNVIVMECDSYEIFPMKENTFWIRYKRNGKIGVFTSQYGNCIYPEFSTIENMGTLYEPLFKGKQYIYQAKLNVLLYMDLQGKVVHQSILNEDQYKKVECQ